MASAVSPMLVRLAEEKATGVLLRDHGALYLVDGEVVHAESPAAPGLDVLLTASGRLPREGWEEAVAEAGVRREVGRHLVASGRLGCGELEICHLGALFDAAYFALTPCSGPTRFRYGVGHWIGRVCPVPTPVVEREAMRRRALLDAIWPHPGLDAAPVIPRDAGPGRGPTRRQAALLALADGVRTPADIARALGRPAFNTLVEVRRLAAAGLVEASAGAAALPPGRPALPAWIPEVSGNPDIALLRRLRDALEATL
ncbi:transcriptional regulator [Streptomyces sp. PR69]|uniref:transcriptional regulator n=1 Tax=Streptomyces sp. PR69 TaxID=2984950 RepID=UPI00226522D4|nr:transcriptional regulator [Streptomyces sp. PR69]